LLGGILPVFLSLGVFGGGKGNVDPDLWSRDEITGTVSDSATTDPIAGAAVFLLGTALPVSSATSDSSGRYRIYPESFGETQLLCEKNGYVSDTQLVNLVPDKFKYEVDFLLVRDSSAR